MQVYAITTKGAEPGDRIDRFEPTLAAAIVSGKKTPPVFRPDLLVLLVEVRTNKESLLWLLNNPHEMTVGLMKEGASRAWTMTRRGGLRPTTLKGK